MTRNGFAGARPDPERVAAFIEGLGDLRESELPLYHLPQVKECVRAGGTIFWAEGEKCVDALWSLRIRATTIAGGADARLQPHHIAALAGAGAVYVFADSDAPGRRYAEAVAEALTDVGIRAKPVFFSKEGGYDVAEYIDEPGRGTDKR